MRDIRRLRPPLPTLKPTGSGAALRRRAKSYREKADALEAMLTDTQTHFAEVFAATDAQLTTRERIARSARGGRRLGTKENQR